MLADIPFFTEGYLDDEDPDNDLHYFGNPNLASTNAQQYLDILPEELIQDGQPAIGFYAKKERDGEGIDHFVRMGYISDEANLLGPDIYRLSFILDDRCCQDYAEKLVPKTISYCSGLLNYFFRGKLEITKKEVEEAGANRYNLTLQVKNESSVDMKGGTFVLMYKKSDTEYAQVSEEATNLSGFNGDTLAPGETTKEWKLEDKVIDIPDYAEGDFSNIEFVLAYKGTLGQEGAVVGKVFNEFVANKYLHVRVVPNYVETDKDDDTQTAPFTIYVQVYNYGSGGTTPQGGVDKKGNTQSYKMVGGEPVLETCYTDQVEEATKSDTFKGIVKISTLFSDISAISLYKEGWDGTVEITNGSGNVSGVWYKTDDGRKLTDGGQIIIQAQGETVKGNGLLLMNMGWIDVDIERIQLKRGNSSGNHYSLLSAWTNPGPEPGGAVPQWEETLWEGTRGEPQEVYTGGRHSRRQRENTYDHWIFTYRVKLCKDLTSYSASDYRSAFLVAYATALPYEESVFYSSFGYGEDTYTVIGDMMSFLGMNWRSSIDGPGADENGWYNSDPKPSMPPTPPSPPQGKDSSSYKGCRWVFRIILVPR